MFAVVFTAALAAAAEKPTQTTTPPATAAEIEQLIGRLDSDQFGQREAAATQLKTLGKAAIPALRKAAVGDSLEVTCRAVDILRLLHESTDAATKTAAEAALKEIANSGHSGPPRGLPRRSSPSPNSTQMATPMRAQPPRPDANLFWGLRRECGRWHQSPREFGVMRASAGG